MNLRTTILLPLAFAGLTAAASDNVTPQAEPPAELDPVEVTAEKRMENAFREVQIGMERVRSDKPEDAEKIVCLKQKPTGSNIAVINCATNRYWQKIRARSLSQGLGAVGGAIAGGGSGSTNKEDKVFTMSLSDYSALQKRFGKLPKDLQPQD
jgi:hypothetical protein